jgi:hypothetical protein
MHQRILKIEEQGAHQGPSDEQVERVLRKILAERFADSSAHREGISNIAKEGGYFVQPPKEDMTIPHAIPIDVHSLLVDPNAMPSKTYAETMQMLEGRLPAFPEVDLSTEQGDQSQDGNQITNSKAESERLKSALDNHQNGGPW